ncbi:MAG: phosphatidylglycerophosphatase A family protein [Lacipirellulaceae bacterium]
MEPPLLSTKIVPLGRLPPSVWFATGLGVGLLRPAPGTLGALWGVPLWLAIVQLPGQAWQFAALAIVVAAGVPICTHAAKALAERDSAVDGKDPQSIVWDELATVPIVYACTPGAYTATTLGEVTLPFVGWLLIGFALHRLMDITKPWPCRALERLPGGWGIMADDVVAALYAGLACHVAWRLSG